MNALSDIAALRAELWAAGHRPVPIYGPDEPVTSAGKRPKGTAWQEAARRNPPAALTTPPQPDAPSTGILCDGLRAVDIDIDDADAAERLEALALSMFGPAPVRYRANSPRRLILLRAAEGAPGKLVLAGTLGKVEILGTGQQFVSHGLHPSGVVLQWRPEPPERVTRDTLPAVSEAEISEFMERAASVIGASYQAEAGRQRETTTPSPAHAGEAEVRAALNRIPNKGPANWEWFNKIGLAIYAARGGAPDGLVLFEEWARQNPEYEEAETRERWANYHRHPPNRTGLASLLRFANDATVSEKQPLFRAPPPAPEYPVQAMGELGRAAEAVNRETQAPISMCAQSVLAAATLAIQMHWDVILPGGRRRPLTGLYTSVAASGERKTTVDNLALRAVHAFEQQLSAQRETEMQIFADAHDAWKAARAAAVKAGKGNRVTIQAALHAIGSEPKAPPQSMVLVADPTPEALVMHLADGRPWGGLFTSEGGMLLGGAAFNDEARVRSGALLNQLWDGEPIRRRRVTTGTQFLPGRRCTVHIMLQPVLVQRLFADSELDGIGLLARTLVVAPDSTAGNRMYRASDPLALAELDAFDARITRLLHRKPRTRDGNPEALDPRPVELSAEAAKLWIAFFNETEVAQQAGGIYASIKPFASKVAEHAGRLGAILTLYADPDATEVSAEAMEGGIALARHYAAEMLRLEGTAGVNDELRRADDLRRWWEETGDIAMHLSRAYQLGPNCIRSAATARAAFGALVDHGYAMPMRAGIIVDGKARREAWRLAE
jgi:hypothetical protein